VTPPAPTVPIVPDWNLVLAASSPHPQLYDLDRIRVFLDSQPDWDAVLIRAKQHGTSSLVYQSLQPVADMVPSAALASLRQRYESNIHNSLFLTRELMRILDAWIRFASKSFPTRASCCRRPTTATSRCASRVTWIYS
jgi:hypothetical protein